MFSDVVGNRQNTVLAMQLNDLSRNNESARPAMFARNLDLKVSDRAFGSQLLQELCFFIRVGPESQFFCCIRLLLRARNH